MDLLIALITWVVLIELIGACAYPFLYRAFHSPELAFAFSRPLGLLFWTFFGWVLTLCSLMAMSLPHLALYTGLLVGAAFWYTRTHFSSLDDVVLPHRGTIIWISGLFWGSFLVLTVIQAFHPEIYWGEKPMDFSFLNYFVRAETLPAMDPWAALEQMHYYYVGYLLFAFLHKLSSMPPAVGYGLSIASVGALLAVSVTAAALVYRVRIQHAVWIGLGVCLLSNLDVIWLVFTSNLPIGFDLYWASSRSLKSPGMNEYPLWTLLFADLHAHLIALPFAASLLGVFAALVVSWDRGDFPWGLAILLGAIWGALTGINTWDCIAYGVFFVVAGLLTVICPLGNWTWERKGRFVLLGMIAGVAALFFTLPFHVAIGSQANVHWGWVYPEEFNSFTQILRVHGVWIFLGLVALPVLSRIRGSFLLGVWVLGVVSVPLLIGAWHLWYLRVPGAPWEVLLLCSIGCAFSLSIFLGERAERKIAALLLCSGFILLACTEVYFLMDRMNTTFKFNHPLWTIMGISTLVLLIGRLQERERVFSSPRFYMASPVLLWCIAGSMVNVWIMTTFQRVPGPRPTLDGTRYLEAFNPSEKKAFDWINQNITGLPHTVEAWGPSYQEFTRFTMHTGLPTVLGWEYHVNQRGTPREQTEQRKDDIRTIYSSGDTRRVMQLLNRYLVEIIIVGKRERETYGVAGLRKFRERPDLFPLLFEFGEGESQIEIFTTRFSRFTQ